MARQRINDQEYGPNRVAVEELVAELEERGVVRTVDAPLIAQVRSLASAVDGNPGSSQLAMQYSAILSKVRTDILRSETEAYEQLQWHLATGCEVHFRTASPLTDVRCGRCVDAAAGLGREDVASWEPPPRWRFEGRANGRPSREIGDAEYARALVLHYLDHRRRGLKLVDGGGK